MEYGPPSNMSQHHSHQIQNHNNHYQQHSATASPMAFTSSYRPQHGHQEHKTESGRSTASPRQVPIQLNTPTTHYAPNDRSLPSREFADEKEFEDAYVAFVLYCNPSIPLDSSTHDLRKNFSSPPRSDGKSFSTKRLFELLELLDKKELKTWTELALELGVEKPAIDKGQSSQKVQQYSVRLKRWLRASHIDAFCDYMMGKHHNYMELPSLHEPFPEQRDGVYVEDDLALRALKPEFRPKRGRKRAESDEIEPMSAIEPKRPHLELPNYNAGPHSAYPGSMSAHPDDLERFGPGDHWLTPANLSSPATAKSNGPTTHRWRLNETPSTPHPMSAVTPISAQPPDSAFDDASGSQSQRMRMRRRHGTAVSSAWPSNSTTPNGKLRGRPPTNRSVKDGPFISFPANPKAKEGPAIDLSRNQIHTPTDELRTPSNSLPPPAQSPNSPFRVPAYPTPVSATAKIPGRPERLSLQVPQHVGNPVRLATPTIAVNGEEEHTFRRPESSHGVPRRSSNPISTHVISTDELKRALAADLLKADVSGRAKALRGTEAKDLAESLLAAMRTRISSPPAEGRSLGATDDTFRLTCASWLGLNPPPSWPSWTPVAPAGVKKIHIRRYRINHDGYDIPVDESDDEAETDSGRLKQTFDIEWDLSLGSISSKFQIKGLHIGETFEHDDEDRLGVADASENWKSKAMVLQAKLKERNEEMKSLKDKVLEAVL
ncbi:hypothetical protein BT63DRAFT_183319 [Microthyrium microscopicum]|uniref:ARS binding protein 2 n=1 Tax=Microthyrium microscopicum TaxID=703497 RepID=A0A6A6UJE6_9PEZI|nr:hypothetical protein BT63DRAFT_183319 [Microthyrium microscopicum]